MGWSIGASVERAQLMDTFKGMSDRWQTWLGLVPRVHREEGKKEEMKEVEEVVPLDL